MIKISIQLEIQWNSISINKQVILFVVEYITALWFKIRWTKWCIKPQCCRCIRKANWMRQLITNTWKLPAKKMTISIKYSLERNRELLFAIWSLSMLVWGCYWMYQTTWTTNTYTFWKIAGDVGILINSNLFFPQQFELKQLNCVQFGFINRGELGSIECYGFN